MVPTEMQTDPKKMASREMRAIFDRWDIGFVTG
jgi:hypothetical protein